MYLTYAEYTAMGGTLEESAYNRYEYRAESIINWYTFNRLANETEYPEAVKKCMFMLIDILIRQDKILDGGDSGEGGGSAAEVASYSNDGVSVSYNVLSASDVSAYNDKAISDTVKRTLQGVVNSLGRRLLYRGLYPGE